MRINNLDENIDAIFVPSLSTSWNGKKLNGMSEQSIILAANFMKEKNIPILMLSHANIDQAEKEKKYKMDILVKMGIDSSKIIHIMPKEKVSSTYTEVRRLSEINETKKFKNVAVVAEKWHMPRVILTIKKIIPDLSIYPMEFQAKKYELLNTKPSYKGIVGSTKLTWILYNIICYILTPVFIRIYGK